MLALHKDQLDIWYLDRQSYTALTPSEQQAYLDVLSVSEKKRYQRLQIDAKREQFLLGKIFIRQVLSRYHPVDPLAWEFVESEHGKPMLSPDSMQQGNPPLSFNLTHSNDLFVLGVCAGHTIGVDVEFAARPRRIRKLAARHFSNQEVTDLEGCSGKEKLQRFYQIWTQKEAYVKAKGSGLTESLQHFTMGLDADSQISFTQHDTQSSAGGLAADRWRFWTFQVQPESNSAPYVASVALYAESDGITLRHRQFHTQQKSQEWVQEVTLLGRPA